MDSNSQSPVKRDNTFQDFETARFEEKSSISRKNRKYRFTLRRFAWDTLLASRRGHERGLWAIDAVKLARGFFAAHPRCTVAREALGRSRYRGADLRRPSSGPTAANP
jgi:hypothetical protein